MMGPSTVDEMVCDLYISSALFVILGEIIRKRTPMPVFAVKDNAVKPIVFAATGFYLALVTMYYLPVPVAHKLCFPVGMLCVASLWLTRWEITCALLFSALGDLAGACGNFMLQMGSFALAHLFFIAFFIRRYKNKVEMDGKFTAKAIGYLSMMGLCVVALLLMAFVKVVPAVPAGMLRVGVSLYAVVICVMLFCALLQRSSLYALGALLFVMSDFMLAWTMFIEPVPCREVLVMGNYFMGQWLLFVRATPYRVKHPVRLLRF